MTSSHRQSTCISSKAHSRALVVVLQANCSRAHSRVLDVTDKTGQPVCVGSLPVSGPRVCLALFSAPGCLSVLHY